MLFVVVAMFVIMWLPLQTFSVIMFLFPNIRGGYQYQSLSYNIFVGTYFACHWLSMAHSCLNPLIYCFMNDNFRTDLQALICWREQSRNNSGSGGFKSVNICSQAGPVLMAPAATPAPANVTSNAAAAPRLRFDEQSAAANKDQPIKVDVQVELNFNQVGKFLGCPTVNTPNSTTTTTTITATTTTTIPSRCDDKIPQFINERLDGTTGHLIELAAESSSAALRQQQQQQSAGKPTNCTALAAFCSFNSSAKRRLEKGGLDAPLSERHSKHHQPEESNRQRTKLNDQDTCLLSAAIARAAVASPTCSSVQPSRKISGELAT